MEGDMKRFSIVLLFCLLGLFACSDVQPPKTDKELYFDFYNRITNSAEQIDNKMQPFFAAIKTGKVLEAINIADSIKDDANQLWSKMYDIKAPVMKNKEAQTELEEAYELITSAYLNRAKVLEGFVNYSKQPSLYSMSDIKVRSEKSQAQVILFAAHAVTAGEKLGLTMDEIQSGYKNVSNPIAKN
jgi:hypothetical protein